MKKSAKPNHIKRNIALAILLALLCIGAAELIACRYFEPEIYERIVAPARYAAAVVVDTGRAGVNAAGRFCQNTWNAVGRLCRDAGDAVSQFIAQTGEQAAAFWEELTAPEELPAESDDPDIADSAEPTATATDPPVTEMLRIGGKQILTGGTVDVTYFCQSSDEWKDQPYGTDTIGPYGCGPTVMAIAVASLTGTDTNPAKMAAWAVEHGYWAKKSGSHYSIIQGTAKDFGILAESFTSREADDMLSALRQGKMLVALVGPGHFTNVGHFILLRGATPDGYVLVADPNSPERSLMLWDPQLILDELSSTQVHGAPLWVLWTSDT